MAKQPQRQPPRVSVPCKEDRAIPVGEVCSRWEWTEASVWTARMLTALENGVRGGKWHSLIDKVYSWDNLLAAYQRVAANKGSPGVDHVSVEAFANHLDEHLGHLHQGLETGTYRPQTIRRVHIPKPGSKETRPLGIPTVRDRVVQAAVKHVLEPLFERDFAEHSYGFRPNRGCKDALRRVDALLKDGYSYVVDADLKSYFDTISHTKLMDLIRDKVSDTKMLSVIASFLEQGVTDDLGTYVPETGSPQGAVISPLLSNIYLDGLDHLMVERGFEMVRYADDFVVLTRSYEQAEVALAIVAKWVKDAELTLHPQKTVIVTHEKGFDFLGYHFERGRRWPRKKSMHKLQDTIRAKTRRTNGHSLYDIIAQVNSTLCGWYAYYKHSHITTFDIVDRWVRMRLRSILRKRDGRSGSGRGFDHRKWPNVYFANHGLLSLRAAYDLDRQSSLR